MRVLAEKPTSTWQSLSAKLTNASRPHFGKTRQSLSMQRTIGSPMASTRRIDQTGEHLSKDVRDLFEPRFGHDLSQIRVHTDAVAGESARAVDALAYTTGMDIVFGAGQYAPSTSQGKLLLAPELAHSVQQARGVVAPGLSRPGDTHESVADEVAARVLAGKDASALLHASSPSIHWESAAVQRQYSKVSTPASNPDAYIPIADFVTYIETVEKKYPCDSPEEIVTRTRQEYYSGMAFEALIPDAHYRRVAPAYAQPPGAGGALLYYSNNLSDMRWDANTRPAYSHLSAHADENSIGDNPSPYIVMPNGSQIDVGHMLLGLDALLHTRVAPPYSAYGIRGIDPASWAADLALASYWTSYHTRTGLPAEDASVKPAKADFDAYYKASTPNEDVLGDADAFGTFQQWGSQSGQSLSQVLRLYYLGASGGTAGVERRWHIFCAANKLGYTVSNGTVTWASTIEGVWEPRINRLCDLFESSFRSRVGSMTVGTAPSLGNWPYSLPALRRFLTWLNPKLEAEMRVTP